MAEVQITKRTPAEQELFERRGREAMRAQVTMFSLMIFLMVVSFGVVVAYQNGVAGISRLFALPMVLLIAAVQVGLQLYYFMHMAEEEHGIPQYFMYMGMILGGLVPLAFVTIIWWN